MTFKVLLEIELSVKSGAASAASDDFIVMQRELELEFAPYPGFVLHCACADTKHFNAAGLEAMKSRLNGRELPVGAGSCHIERVHYFVDSKCFHLTAVQYYPTRAHVIDARDYLMHMYEFTQNYPDAP